MCNETTHFPVHGESVNSGMAGVDFGSLTSRVEVFHDFVKSTLQIALSGNPVIYHRGGAQEF